MASIPSLTLKMVQTSYKGALQVQANSASPRFSGKLDAFTGRQAALIGLETQSARGAVVKEFSQKRAALKALMNEQVASILGPITLSNFFQKLARIQIQDSSLQGFPMATINRMLEAAEQFGDASLRSAYNVSGIVPSAKPNYETFQPLEDSQVQRACKTLIQNGLIELDTSKYISITGQTAWANLTPLGEVLFTDLLQELFTDAETPVFEALLTLKRKQYDSVLFTTASLQELLEKEGVTTSVDNCKQVIGKLELHGAAESAEFDKPAEDNETGFYLKSFELGTLGRLVTGKSLRLDYVNQPISYSQYNQK